MSCHEILCLVKHVFLHFVPAMRIQGNLVVLRYFNRSCLQLIW